MSKRAFGLAQDAGLPADPIMDDVYKPVSDRPGTIQKPLDQVAREGFGDAMWWETDFEEEVSDKWRI